MDAKALAGGGVVYRAVDAFADGQGGYDFAGLVIGDRHHAAAAAAEYSGAIIELILWLESEYGITIPQQEFSAQSTRLRVICGAPE